MLTDDAVMEIRVAHAGGAASMAELAQKYGVAKATVRDVVYGYSFKHLPLVAPHAYIPRDRAILRAPRSDSNTAARFVRRLIGRWIAGRELQGYERVGHWVKERLSSSHESSGDELEGFNLIPIINTTRGAHISRYTDVSSGKHSTFSTSPSDALCWILTFEIILKKLLRREYVALAKWYKSTDPPNDMAAEAIEAIRYECRVRNFS
jgi:hypothetical protein